MRSRFVESDNGQGLYGETNDKVVSFIGLGLVVGFTLFVILASALQLLTANERAAVAALAFSVNPPSDTTTHVRKFLHKHHAESLTYLVDTTANMRPIWRRFGILPAVDTVNADVHSAGVRIFDRRGIWVSTLHVAVDLTARNLVHDIRTAVDNS